MQQNYPQKTGIDFILKDAFSYWSKTLLYQVLYSLLYISVLILVFYYASAKYGILEQYLALGDKLKDGFDVYQAAIAEMTKSPGFMTFYWIMIGALVFLYPLNLGFYKMFRKIDTGEKPLMEDLFAGYLGTNFFIYTSFYLFWFLIYLYAMPTVILGVVWVFITLFAAPLMFFMDKKIFESISLTWKALKLYPLEILVCSIVAIMFKYVGVLTIIGAIFTLPFWNPMIYALYKKVFNEVELNPEK